MIEGGIVLLEVAAGLAACQVAELGHNLGKKAAQSSVGAIAKEEAKAITATWSSSVVAGAAAEADKRIRKTIRRNSKHEYWTANMKRGYVDIGKPISYAKAVKEVASNRNVFTIFKYNAKKVARAAGGKLGSNNKPLHSEIDKGKEKPPFYYHHFHTSNRKGGHVFYLFIL